MRIMVRQHRSIGRFCHDQPQQVAANRHKDVRLAFRNPTFLQCFEFIYAGASDRRGDGCNCTARQRGESGSKAQNFPCLRIHRPIP